MTATFSASFAPLAAMLLAPLPQGEEAAASPRFLKRLEHDRRIPWDAGLQAIEEAGAAHTLAVAADRRAGHLPIGARSLETYKAYHNAVDAQLCIPAPSARETRWKARQLVERFSAEAKAQYARDCAAHGVKWGEKVAPRKITAASKERV